jgi:hypothetical protein
VALKPGVAVSEVNKHSASSDLHAITAPVALFMCPFDGCLGQTNGTTKWLSTCADGYTGALCAQCEDSWIRSGTECIECSDTTGKSVAVVVVVALILPGSLAMSKVGERMSMFSGFMVQAKIIIGWMQIVTELPHTLKLVYPQQFTAILRAIRILMLDIFDMFSIDCISTPLSLHARFIVIMLLPVVGLLIVLVMRFASNCRAERASGTDETIGARKAAIQATASYRAFFVLFMLYPLLSRTVFHMFGCHRLDVAERWHPDDYGINCDTATHTGFVVAAGFGVAIFPIGIPLTFLVLLWRSQRGRNLGDTDTSPYDFLRKDYQYNMYYYEVVVLIEKLLLAGVLIFIDQGSVFQAFCGLVIAFAFFAIQCRMWPYLNFIDNLLKAVAEAQLFIILAISVVLRTDLYKDALTPDDYGVILTVVFFAAPSVELLYVFAQCFEKFTGFGSFKGTDDNQDKDGDEKRP